jgi:hypothetical protein
VTTLSRLRSPLDARDLIVALYFHDPLWLRDIDLMLVDGRVTERAIKDDADSPSGWFARASEFYGTRQVTFGEIALGIVATRFREGDAS